MQSRTSKKLPIARIIGLKKQMLWHRLVPSKSLFVHKTLFWTFKNDITKITEGIDVKKY